MAEIVRRGGARYWRGVPVKLKPFVDRHFEVRFHGIGFWMCPIVIGMLVWRRRPTVADEAGKLG